MDFPQELINLIVHFSSDDIRALLTWCLVSRACLHEAKPLIYKNISISPSRDPQVQALAKSLFGAPTPLDPQLASYIQDLTIDADYYPQLTHSVLPKLLHVLRDTFASTHNLTHLRFAFPDQCDEDFPIKTVLLGHSFQLKGFYWRDFRWFDHLQPSLDVFLASQPCLRTLEIIAESYITSPVVLAIPPTACPELETFSGSFKHFQVLASTRPVVNFVWSGVSPVPASVLELDSISSALSRLRVLVIHEGFPKELDIALLASRLTLLEVLHISLEITRNTIQSYPQIWRGQRFVEHIHTLPNLRIFALCVEPPQMQLCEQYQHVLTTRWYNALPNFSCAYFSGAMMCSDLVSCWSRDSDSVQPKITTMQEVRRVYATREVGLDPVLLEPFFGNSRRSASVKSGLVYADEVEGLAKCDFGKRAQHGTGVRMPWWKKALSWEATT